MLEAVNLNQFFGSFQALDSVTFAIGRGEVAGVLGLAGSGKSTLMRLLSGFLEPTHGKVRVAGLDPRLAAARQRIGYLPEANPLPDRMRVGEYLNYRAGLKGLHGASAGQSVARVVKWCDLKETREHLIARPPGEARLRVGLADCLLGSPKALLLDNPLSDSDPGRTALIREVARRLDGATILVSSQSPHELERLCGRLLILHRGRMLADDTPENIYKRTVTERVIDLELVSSEPVRGILRAVAGVRTVAVEPSPDSPGALCVRLGVPAGVDLRRELSQACLQRGWLITGMRLEPVGLAEIIPKIANHR